MATRRDVPVWKYPATFARFLRAIHGADYLNTKARDFQVFTRFALLATALFVATTVLWDYANDPAHFQQILVLRLIDCAAVLVWAAVSWRRVDSPAARLATLAVPLLVEAIFVKILTILDQGAAYGIGAFLYFYIFMPFLMLAQPFVFSLAVLVAIAVFPLVADTFGLSANIDWGVYNAYVWMGLLPVAAILLSFESMYRQLVTYRQQVEAQAFTDGLTQIANRRRFLVEGLRLLRLHYRNQRPATLLFVDVDRFKAINDAHGHNVGDETLKGVVRVLTSALRASDLMARYGGEEFLVLLPETRVNDGLQLAERIRRTVADTSLFAFADQAAELRLTVSIGIAHYDPAIKDMPDIDVLIEQADHALYEAKRSGRNRVSVYTHARHRRGQPKPPPEPGTSADWAGP